MRFDEPPLLLLPPPPLPPLLPVLLLPLSSVRVRSAERLRCSCCG
jgi:hypothetical protein